MPDLRRSVPRFEFRIFGTDIDGPSRALAALGLPQGAESRRDLYCLAVGAGAGASLKLRGASLELKLLRAVRTPFELWELAQRRRFPIPAALLEARLLGPAGIALPLPAGPVGVAEFLARTGADPRLRLLAVAKRRQRFDLITAIGEVTDLRIEGAAWRTLAIEGPDRAALGRILDRLGLAGERNVSFPRKLQEIVEESARMALPT